MPRLFVLLLLSIFLLSTLICPQDALAGELLPGLQMVNDNTPESGVYKFKVEHGTRCTKNGTMQAYTIYIPQGDKSHKGGPFPAVMLIHGFLMTGEQHQNNAEYLAEHGFIAFTPNISKWLWGDDKRMRNVADLTDALAWLTGKTGAQPDCIKGKIDTSRIAAAGNSSGGAVALELALQAQAQSIPLKAIISLDGVPWDRTLNRIHDIEPLDFLCLRAESCLCNYHARMLKFLANLSFPYEDIKVTGAHHCDVENPTTLGCYSVCGKSDNKHRLVFQYLLYLYLRDKLSAPTVGLWQQSFASVLAEMQAKNEITYSTATPRGIKTAIDPAAENLPINTPATNVPETAITGSKISGDEIPASQL